SPEVVEEAPKARAIELARKCTASRKRAQSRVSFGGSAPDPLGDLEIGVDVALADAPVHLRKARILLAVRRKLRDTERRGLHQLVERVLFGEQIGKRVHVF